MNENTYPAGWIFGNINGQSNIPSNGSIDPTLLGANQQNANNSGVDAGYGNPSAGGTSSSINSSAPSTPSANSALAGGIAGSAVGLVAGVGQTIWAGHELHELNKQQAPNYSLSPELQNAYNDALSNKNIGLTAEEKAGFQSNVNRGSATNLYNAQKMAGGNLSVALEGAVSSENLGAYDKLASVDADTRRANQQQYYNMADKMQNQRNMISHQNIAYRMQQEQMYGQALQSGLSNMTKGAQGVATGIAGLA
jgi:hypothetical protein